MYLDNEANTKDVLSLRESSDNSFKLEYPINKSLKKTKINIGNNTVKNNLIMPGKHEDSSLKLKDSLNQNPSILAKAQNQTLPMLCLDTEIKPGHHINLKIYEGDTADIISEKLIKEHCKLM